MKMNKEKNRKNERNEKFLKESEKRFNEFHKIYESSSLAIKSYLNLIINIFAKEYGRLEGILFFELVRKIMKEQKIGYTELLNRIDNVLDRPFNFEIEHLRLVVNRKNYKSTITEPLKKALELDKIDIEKEYTNCFGFDSYLKNAYLSLDTLTQNAINKLAECSYSIDNHIQSNNFDYEENDNGLINPNEIYRRELGMSKKEYKEYKDQEQYLDYKE